MKLALFAALAAETVRYEGITNPYSDFSLEVKGRWQALTDLVEELSLTDEYAEFLKHVGIN